MPIIESEFLELTTGLDLDAFWSENQLCQRFTPNKPRCALSLSPDDHWLFEFMSVPSTIRYYFDKAYRDSLHREVNETTQRYLGRTYFEEDTWEQSPKRIENLFGCEFTYTEGATPWLTAATGDPDEFARILDEAERTDVSKWALPEEFLREWEVRRTAGRELPLLGTGSRGPATIMTSILHPETAIYWFHDHAPLMRRFRDILATKIVEFNQVLRRFSGNTAPNWWVTDDNSALFSPRLYREFCVPVLQRLLDAMAPGNGERFQHSDSAMGHLLDDQRALGINSVNYGPSVDAALIRAKMPGAIINGHTPPLLLRNGAPDEIVERVVSDFARAGASGGLVVTTAGSLAAGTGVGRIRWFMQAVERHCRYD
jgi:uroporphyrinogen decarboxylase